MTQFEVYRFPADLKGVIVSNVVSGGPADRAGLETYDVILAVGRRNVTNVREFTEAIRSIGKDGIAFRVRRGDSTELITVKP